MARDSLWRPGSIPERCSVCPFSSEASCPSQDEVKEVKRLERMCWTGYIVLTTLGLLTVAVAGIAEQIHDWLLFAAAISAFMLVTRTNYRWTRRRP